MLATVELRTGARFGRGDSLEKTLARFTARVMPYAGRVEPAAAEAILDQAAAQIADLVRTQDRKEGTK
ncbi:Uncharacterised protein [Mycobacteroides abscessus subsp. abscessus]|nr:Uncharacterised protein [Mycobacteroides abscessus subsp. abscessus]SKW26226.1 Uncharacterised protein [Mycobacteroides abscessus subsp. abscessus]